MIGSRLNGRGAVKCRVIKIDIFLIHLFFAAAKALTESLKMHDFTLSQESDDIVDVRVIGKTKDVVIGFACFLLGSQVLRQIGDHVSRRLN